MLGQCHEEALSRGQCHEETRNYLATGDEVRHGARSRQGRHQGVEEEEEERTDGVNVGQTLRQRRHHQGVE